MLRNSLMRVRNSTSVDGWNTKRDHKDITHWTMYVSSATRFDMSFDVEEWQAWSFGQINLGLKWSKLLKGVNQLITIADWHL